MEAPNEIEAEDNREQQPPEHHPHTEQLCCCGGGSSSSSRIGWQQQQEQQLQRVPGKKASRNDSTTRRKRLPVLLLVLLLLLLPLQVLSSSVLLTTTKTRTTTGTETATNSLDNHPRQDEQQEATTTSHGGAGAGGAGAGVHGRRLSSRRLRQGRRRPRRSYDMDNDEQRKLAEDGVVEQKSHRKTASDRAAAAATDAKEGQHGDLQAPLPEAVRWIPMHAYSGTQHVHVWMGTPPQRQVLIVDTGSRISATVCNPCLKCGTHASPYFDPANSSTFDKPLDCRHCFLVADKLATCQKEGCEVFQRYTEGSSWEAMEVHDVAMLGTELYQDIEAMADFMAVPFVFACQYSVKGQFEFQYADGILGLEHSPHSFIGALHRQGAISTNAFSLCHDPTGGWLGIGGAMTPLHDKEPDNAMLVTPIWEAPTDQRGWFTVEMFEVLLADVTVVGGPQPTNRSNVKAYKQWKAMECFHEGKGTILDSGTTDTYLPSRMEHYLATAWEAYTGKSYNKQRTAMYTWDELLALPDITFVFVTGLENNNNKNVDNDNDTTIHNVTARIASKPSLTMKPIHYMDGTALDDYHATGIPWQGATELTNRLYADEPTGAVLGLNAMQGHDILFDATNNRIGFANADCSVNPTKATPHAEKTWKKTAAANLQR